MKRPSFQFYPADWRKDSALQSCSMAAQGLWISLICVMHECDRYGHLSVKNKPMTADQASRLVGLSVKEFKKLLAELEDSGVFTRLEDSTIFSKRMVKDERLRTIRAEAGRLGGNPSLVEGKDNDLLKQKDNQTSKQKPTPSSSSSSTTSKSKSKSNASVDAITVFPEIMNRQVVNDWLAIRKEKRLPVTETAMIGIKREADKAKMTVESVLRLCCERGWGSFGAKWVEKEMQNTTDKPLSVSFI